ncbi:MAG: hypothetical protein KC649_06510, partial [Candidatus Omnitrophica bacterium]|nr:hypothetical protein [Candidatus Omnitrophota bacterium]
LIILFSDAHTNASAQMNLAEAMRHVMSREEIDWVFTEAAVADNSVHFLRQLTSDSKEIEAVAKRYLHKAKINGVEYLNLTSGNDFKIWGVEDKSLYLKSLQVYSESFKQRENLKRKLSEAEKLFRVLETRILNPEMLDLYISRSAYLKDELPAVDYLLKLSVLKKQYMPSASERISVIQTLADIKRIENSLDFEKAQNELSELLEKENADSGILQPNRISFKSTSGTSAVKEFLIRNKAYLEGKEELKKYAEYIRQFESVDLNHFEKERTETEDHLFMKMSSTGEEAEFVGYADALNRLEKLSELKLNADEYRKIKNNPDLHSYERISAFLNGMLLKYTLSGEKVLFSDASIQGSLNQSAAFYELTSERDQVFYKEMRQKMRSGNIQKACLVTGGYHTENMKKILRSSGISYISVLPAVSHETDFVRYERMLLSQTSSSDYRQYAALHNDAQRRSALMTLYAARKEFDSPEVLYELAREFGGSKDWVDRQLLSAARLSSDDSESEESQEIFRKMMTALRTVDDNFDDPDSGARIAVPSELSSNEAAQNLLMETFNQTEESLDKYLKQGSVDL